MFSKWFRSKKDKKKFISGMIVNGSPIITKAVNVSDEEIARFKKLLIADYNSKGIKNAR